MLPIAMQSTSRTFMATSTFFQHMRWFSMQAPASSRLAMRYCQNISLTTQHAKTPMARVNWAKPNRRDAVDCHLIEPMLTAAQANTQAEFDRAYRSISQDKAYRGRNLLYIAGLHVDISPSPEQAFVLTKFIPGSVCAIEKW